MSDLDMLLGIPGPDSFILFGIADGFEEAGFPRQANSYRSLATDRLRKEMMDHLLNNTVVAVSDDGDNLVVGRCIEASSSDRLQVAYTDEGGRSCVGSFHYLNVERRWKKR